ALVDDDLRAWHLAEASVLAAEDARLRDARKTVDALLDFLGKELEPGDEDDSCPPAFEVERPRLVEPADVARQEPAVPRDLLAQSPRRVVRGEETASLHRNLAHRPRMLPRALAGEHRDLVAGNGPSDRRSRQTRVTQIDAGEAGFDDAVRLADGYSIAR